ncbi:MAG: HAD family hydrolase [Alphaproteobacteria bacterium]
MTSDEGQGTDLARPRAILFDWDGTLVDSWKAIQAALNATLVAMGREPWTLEETQRSVRRSMREAFPELFGDRWEAAAEVFYREYATLHLEHTTPIPGAAELLSSLDGSGVYLGVVSNKNGKYLRREACHLGWEGHFGRIVGATDAAEDKPSPEVIKLALEGSGVSAGPEVWLVGDAGIDLQCAENAGLTGIMVGDNQETTASGGREARRFANCLKLADFLRRVRPGA